MKLIKNIIYLLTLLIVTSVGYAKDKAPKYNYNKITEEIMKLHTDSISDGKYNYKIAKYNDMRKKSKIFDFVRDKSHVTDTLYFVDYYDAENPNIRVMYCWNKQWKNKYVELFNDNPYSSSMRKTIFNESNNHRSTLLMINLVNDWNEEQIRIHEKNRPYINTVSSIATRVVLNNGTYQIDYLYFDFFLQ